ncbi:disrupted in schizophrenia 1 protein [Stegastes partitus]|uniref:DISC1 scaffold protein n=1 Tax=Stegastes partitus TaxID=144197 RepID=A0A3B4ZJE8_9TELE|nr:PREDICTED: disrupted in schizophrenia 1 protein [Stegastes partitus]XP_008300107.1 PREDICTED: disrupted in schizophrenia 1 protein [Stegastes partitus]
MFAGLMGLECRSSSLLQHCEAMEGGRASGTAGSCGRKRLHRRPGYMRGEQSRTQSTSQEEEEEEEDGRTACIRNGKSVRHTDIADATSAQRLTPAVKVSLLSQQQPDKLTCTSCKSKSFLCCVTRHLPPFDCSPVNSTSSRLVESSTPQNELRLSPSPALRSSPEDSFNSSFSFIQQSLSSSQKTGTTITPIREPLSPSAKGPNLPQTKLETLSTEHNFSKQAAPVQTLSSSAPGSHADREELSLGGRFWLADCDSRPLDIEVTSSLSVDSDTASASSVTSGYDSATPASEQGWDNLVKKYEGVLQDCLQNNRAHTKIESMMLKLQRLQQKAILDDDYDAAERFGKKLEELCRERGALKLGLPSRQPSVALFLERLRQVVHSALQRADCSQRREGAELDAGERSDLSQGPLQRRERLIQEKRLVEEEIAELQQRLAELKDRSRCLEQQIQQEEQQVEAEELEGSVLKSCTVAQLRDMSRTLQDLVTSENRTQISVSPPPSMLRLQEQEQALNLSIKEATAKVVMSQRLGSSLRRKVSETETQLLALHEAKLAAISGNDFSSAKELKAEMKAVYLERDRLEALAKRLHSLSSGSSQELARMKEQRQQLRQELEQREAQHESRLKENTTKYVELLEDRLHSCGCPGLERIWEADLEACHLFLRGLQLRTPSCSGADMEDLPPAAVYPPTQLCTKEEEDCAMLTALGGRWCPEANLQNSEFTKKLEEFLFCMEDNHPEDGCSEAEATDLTERCELISDRLMTLEDELQTAMLNRDQALTQSLEKEVQEVKSTLQTMLAQLKVEDEEEEEEEEVEEEEEEVNELNDLMKNGTEEEEEEEEEEDQYFSDSWDI